MITLPGEVDGQRVRVGCDVVAVDRLQWTTQPPRLIATSAGDHAAHHPSVLAAVRTAVLPVTTAFPKEHIPVLDITSIGESPNRLAPPSTSPV